MERQHSAPPWRRSAGVTPTRCESCRRRRRCELVRVRGATFVVCPDCAELAFVNVPKDAA